MRFARTARMLLQVAVFAVMVAPPVVAQDKISLVGSGSNLAGSLYSEWTTEFAKQHPDVEVRYLALGTSQSLQEIRQGTGDFGGGEIPLSDVQKHGGKYTLIQFPTVLVAIAPIYKLPGMEITVVHLSGVKGSNYILTDFLSRTSTEWKSKIGKNASPAWPVGVDTNRSEGMVTKVSATPGEIGRASCRERV